MSKSPSTLRDISHYATFPVHENDTNSIDPPLKLVNFSDQGKGNGLVATRVMKKGQVVFQETQTLGAVIPMPPRYLARRPSQHCHTCLQSMEPLSQYVSVETTKLPLPHLWPHPEFNEEFQECFQNGMARMEKATISEDTDTTNNHKFLQDDHGRILCRYCHALFCSYTCKDRFLSIIWDCCVDQQVYQTIVETILEYNHSDNDISLADYWEVFLASRIFATHYFENEKHFYDNDQATISKELVIALQDLCGEVDNLTQLKVGLPVAKLVESSNNGKQQPRAKGAGYTVEPFYRALCQVLSKLGIHQGNPPSLESFTKLIAQCSRNTLMIQTISPFATYEANVMKHLQSASEESNADQIQLKQELRQQVARVLMKEVGVTNALEDVGSVSCYALLPLFARLNHSCDPNLQVVDGLSSRKTTIAATTPTTIQLVATRDIDEGEELTTSYLSDHAMALNVMERNQRLKTRYLFICQCSRCQAERTQKENTRS